MRCASLPTSSAVSLIANVAAICAVAQTAMPPAAVAATIASAPPADFSKSPAIEAPRIPSPAPAAAAFSRSSSRSASPADLPKSSALPTTSIWISFLSLMRPIFRASTGKKRGGRSLPILPRHSREGGNPAQSIKKHYPAPQKRSPTPGITAPPSPPAPTSLRQASPSTSRQSHPAHEQPSSARRQPHQFVQRWA